MRAALLDYDGKAVSHLSETGVRFAQDPEYLADLVALSADPEAHIADGATWLIKDHLETGGTLAADLVAPWLHGLKTSASWAALLHILQSARFLDLAEITDGAVFAAILRLAGHERPFLRAWATDAYWRAAQAHPDLRSRAEDLVEKASNDPAASVRARARNIEKEMSR